MSSRTDLAIEFEKIEKNSEIEHIKIGENEIIFNFLKENNIYSKPQGKYATLKLNQIENIIDFKNEEKAISFCLEKMLPKKREKVLIVGLGNKEISADCIGPFTAQKILATRHISRELSQKIGLEGLKSVAVITPNVLGKTGIETAETVGAVVKQIKPDAVIVIDALCASKTENLFSVIQFCDSGISPGSGVKNTRKELSFKTLGVPTVAIGVPTVVEAFVVAEEFLPKRKVKTDLVLTPKDTDLLCHRMSELLGQALNVFLQPKIERQIILDLV